MGYNNQSTVFGYQGAGVNFLAIGKGGTMADLQVTGYGDSYEDGGISAVKLDIYGRDSGPKMIWVDADYGTDGTWYGWYNDGWDDDIGARTNVNPGESMWLMCPTAGWTLNWPSAFNPDSNAEERAKK